MAIFKYSGIGISGISAAAPKEKYNNLVHNDFFTEEEVKSIVNKTGIKERRVASSNICASDLCYFAAKQLLKEMVIDINTIDVLIFISQTADYRMPATSIILQDRLGLPSLSELVDNETGYIVPLDNSANLIQTFREIASDFEMPYQKGKKAAKKIAEICSYEKMVNAYRELYLSAK